MYYLLLFILMFIVYDLTESKRSKGGSSSYKRSKDSKTHSTTKCSSSSSKCTCSNRPYEVKIGSDSRGFEDSYSGPYQLNANNNNYYGNEEIYCYDYMVARVENKYSTCSSASLDYVIIGINQNTAACQKIECSTYQKMLYSYNCDCGCSSGRSSDCCSVTVTRDYKMGLIGIKITFERPIDKNNDEQAVTICLRNIDELSSSTGLISYYMKDTNAFACDSYDIPNFCDGL